METKKIGKFAVATIKRTAQNVNSMVVKRDKLMAEIMKLQAECDSLNKSIAAYNAPVKEMTGFNSEELVKKVVETVMNEDGTVKMDKNGSPVKVTKWVLRYPDTIIPTMEDKTPVESYNENQGEGHDVEVEDNFFNE